MNNNSIKQFKEYELYPAMYGDLTRAFPELHFEKKGDRWESKYHIDGERDSKGVVTTYVYSNNKSRAVDYARGTETLVDLYMKLNNKDFATAYRDLAKLYSLTLPDYNREEENDYREEQRLREEACKIFKKALWNGSPEATETLNYLHNRGWKDEEIKKAELGLITPNIRDSLPEGIRTTFFATERKKVEINGIEEEKILGRVAETHKLAIPYRSGVSLLGFTFRRIFEREENGQKYLNSTGLKKTSLLNIGVGAKDIVIVEGYLDALHAKAQGIENVVATTQAKTSSIMIEEAIRRGVEKFTLLYDMDATGMKSIAPTAELIHRINGDRSIYVASLPEGIKDLDEYLTKHSAEEYREIVAKAVTYSSYWLSVIIKKYSGKAEALTAKEKEDLFRDIEKLLNSPYTKPYERENLYKQLEQYEQVLNFKVSDFRDFADSNYLREQAKTRATEVKEASTLIADAVKANNIDEALRLMRETASTQSQQEKAVEFAKVFAPKPPQEYEKLLSEIKEGIPTGFIFEQRRQREELTLNPGLTFICGYRGHGKTTFLNNIALNEAKRNVALENGKSVLYFSYEVDRRRLTMDLLNTFVNDNQISRNPQDTILSYFNGKGGEYFRNDRRTDGRTHYENFITQKEIFFRDYLSSGALTIIDEPYKVEDLLDGIKFYLSGRDVSIICIDYAQLIYSKEYSRQRTEEIKKVVNDIKDFANREAIPFVLAGQFNREVVSPLDVDTRNIGEGGDFERIADTCIGLFNLKELRALSGSNDKKELKDILRAVVYPFSEELLPSDKHIFVRLMKRRYGVFPLDTLLEWDGSTKYIKPNYPEALSIDCKQGDLFNEDDDFYL